MRRSELETFFYSILSGVYNVPVFWQDTRDPNYQGEYIEIIPLTFDMYSLLASSVVNINVHVPDVRGLKNATRINYISDRVTSLFQQEEDASGHLYRTFQGVQFEIESTTDYKDDNNTHFRNFRIKVTYLNL